MNLTDFVHFLKLSCLIPRKQFGAVVLTFGLYLHFSSVAETIMVCELFVIFVNVGYKFVGF